MVSRATSPACPPVPVIGPAHAKLATARKTTISGLSRTMLNGLTLGLAFVSEPTTDEVPGGHGEQGEEQAQQHHVGRGVVAEDDADAEEGDEGQL